MSPYSLHVTAIVFGSAINAKPTQRNEIEIPPDVRRAHEFANTRGEVGVPSFADVVEQMLKQPGPLVMPDIAKLALGDVLQIQEQNRGAVYFVYCGPAHWKRIDRETWAAHVIRIMEVLGEPQRRADYAKKVLDTMI